MITWPQLGQGKLVPCSCGGISLWQLEHIGGEAASSIAMFTVLKLYFEAKSPTIKPAIYSIYPPGLNPINPYTDLIKLSSEERYYFIGAEAYGRIQTGDRR
jgi:hypothetical protein